MNSDSFNKIRIKDIATLSGVSVGTVDRVIHQRGQVSEENREKIQKIIDELEYKPNMLARSLASKRNYVFVTLLPEYQYDYEYWEAPVRGIQRAWREILDFNVTVKNLAFNQFKVESFELKCKELLDLSPDAVLLSPVFRKETIALSQKLNDLKIPYTFIDSNIEELENLCYFGQNSYQSGYLAARLLHMGLAENSVIANIKSSRAIESNQLINRESGFFAFFEKNGLKDKFQFIDVMYDLGNDSDRKLQFDKLFNPNKQISAAIVFNSRVSEIAAYIESNQLSGIKLIGYDLVQKNAEYLKKNTVTFLIAQRPEEQGYLGIMSLFNHLVLKQESVKIQYVPIDILTCENLDYYVKFSK
jgi:LacI family transcriptional regulator